MRNREIEKERRDGEGGGGEWGTLPFLLLFSLSLLSSLVSRPLSTFSHTVCVPEGSKNENGAKEEGKGRREGERRKKEGGRKKKQSHTGLQVTAHASLPHQ